MDPDALAARGRELMAEGRHDDALSFFEQALAARPGDPDALNAKGAALRSLGRYSEAVECFNRSLELDPRDRASS